MPRYMKSTGFAAALVAAALFGAFVAPQLVDAQTPRATSLSLVAAQRDRADADARAAAERARTAIHADGCVFERGPAGQFWVTRDCAKKLTAPNCEAVRQGNRGEQRVGWSLIPGACQVTHIEPPRTPEVRCHADRPCTINVIVEDAQGAVRTVEVVLH